MRGKVSGSCKRRRETDEVLQSHLRGLVDRLEEGEDVVRVAICDGDADIVVCVVLREWTS